MGRVGKILLIILPGLIPVLVYWIFQNVPKVTPDDVKEILTDKSENILVLDVREEERYNKEHIGNAINIPYYIVLDDRLSQDQLNQLKSKDVYVICEAGISSVLVTRMLRQKGINAFNIEGGMNAWIASADKKCTSLGCTFKTAIGETKSLPYRASSIFEQLVAITTGFVVKPFYILLSLLIVILLWRKTQPEFIAIKWALIFFFIGENLCALNYIFYTRHDSHLMEYTHAYGMVLCFGFATYAMFETIDRYMINYSDSKKKCSLLNCCKHCIKYEKVSCGLQKCFIFLSLAGAVLAFMPFCTPLHLVSYNTRIWGTFFNYSNPIVMQVFEMRYCPALGLIMFLISALILWLKQNVPLSKVFFAAGSGALGFSLLRFVIFNVYQSNLVWADCWEEITEFLFVSGIVFVLWIFRSSWLSNNNSSLDIC